MKFRLWSILMLIVLAVLPSVVASAQPVDPLAGTSWQLTSIGGRDVMTPQEGEQMPTLTFGSDGTLSGHGGCNSFSGSYTLSDDTLTVSELVSTRRACRGRALMQQEREFLAALGSASAFRVEDGQLVLEYGRGKSLVLSSMFTLMDTAWQLVSYGDVDEPTLVANDTLVTLSFSDEGTAGGSGGCNNYGGSYTVGSAGSIRFSEIASTMMACLEEGVMEQEGAYLEALNRATSYTLTLDQLVIAYGEGEQLIFVALTGDSY